MSSLVVSSEKEEPSIRGWAEVLYLKDEFIDLLGRCNLPHSFTKEHYDVVGSWLPLQEYCKTYDIVRHFAGHVEDYVDVPRPIRAYDALNLCSIDPRGLLSLLVVPAKYRANYDRRMKPQMPEDVDKETGLMLVNFPKPLGSFRMPSWPN